MQTTKYLERFLKEMHKTEEDQEQPKYLQRSFTKKSSLLLKSDY